MTGKSFDAEFETFVSSRQRVRCATCALPPDVRKWAEDKVRAGAAKSAVANFLVSQGHKLSPSALINHMGSHVS